MNIQKELFGEIDSKEVYEYTLTNSSEFSISVITYGGIITKIMAPDRDGNLENITVNVNSLEEIVAARPFHGAIIGRVGGRISNAGYMDGDTRVDLTVIEKGNTLHGGKNGLDTKLWDATIEETTDFVTLVLETKLQDGEDGFPGEMDIVVKYTLHEDNKIEINYEGKTTKRTIFNPTNHLYFNLTGDQKNTIDSHSLQINADYYGPTKEDDTPTGELVHVENTGYDLRQGNKLENVFQSEDENIQAKGGLDNPFVLNKEKDIPAVTLIESESGRSLELFTEAKAVVVYTHNHEQVPETENAESIKVHSGLALEAQQLPDAVNHEAFGSIWLDPEETFTSKSTFKFNVID